MNFMFIKLKYATSLSPLLFKIVSQSFLYNLKALISLLVLALNTGNNLVGGQAKRIQNYKRE